MKSTNLHVSKEYIVALYESGLSGYKISAKTGMNHGVVYRILKEMGTLKADGARRSVTKLLPNKTPEWSNLKDNMCPKCNLDLKHSWSVEGVITCSCTFTFTLTRYQAAQEEKARELRPQDESEDLDDLFE